MAKLRDQYSTDVQYKESGVKGIYYPSRLSFSIIRDFRTFCHSTGLIESGKKGEAAFFDNYEKVILWLFDNILCDKNGEAFEDVKTEEDIDILNHTDLMTIISTVIPVLSGETATRKKSSRSRTK